MSGPAEVPTAKEGLDRPRLKSVGTMIDDGRPAFPTSAGAVVARVAMMLRLSLRNGIGRSGRYKTRMSKLPKADKAERTVSATVKRSERIRVLERASREVSAKTPIDFRRAVRKK
jgi:hypothetical protein